MRIGVQLPEVEREVRWREIVAIARAAENAGFASIWLGDHMLYRGGGRPERGPWDVWTQLAGLAAVTTRVTLGPLVTATAFYAPGLLARMAASVDEISAGRLVLGVGAGWNETEFRAFGFPFDALASRFEESFEIVRRLLADEHVTHSGRFVSVFDAVVLPRPARRIPLMIGSNGPRMLAAALPYVDAWNTWYSSYGNTVDGFAELSSRIDQATRAAGRDPKEIAHSACVLVAVGDERERTHDVAPVTAAALPAHLRELGRAGADEAICVIDPITERSVAELGALVRP
jgi:alkanesulfonate monooxygenase SsuD/methylene tetrahydromethanopterin reductase-like flavin-dependent oxidoreductase (luciferase family)